MLSALRLRFLCAVLLGLLGGGLLVTAAQARPLAAPSDVPICSTEWIRAISADTIAETEDQFVLRPLAAIAAQTTRFAGQAVDPAFLAAAFGSDGPVGVAGTDQSTLPNDIVFLQRYQQNLRAMNAVEAWQVTFGSSDVTIAIIADGVEIGHQDLAQKIWRNPGEIPGNGIDDDGNGYVDDVTGWDFGDRDADPSPIADPAITRYYPPTGTAMAGLIAAQTNNEIGMAGIAWHSRILPLKTHRLIEFQGRPAVGGKLDYVTEAICYAANAGAEVIVVGGISLNNPTSALQDLLETRQAIQYAWRTKGSVVVAPAGECGTPAWWCPDEASYGHNPPTYPASLAPDAIIGVAAYDHRTLKQRSNASHGDWVDISAPGEGFYTSWRGSNYHPIDGTYNTPSDMAAAHVAGVVALMRSANPTYTPEMVEGKLCEFAIRDAGGSYQPVEGRRWPWDPHYGCGRLQAEKVLDGMPWQVLVSPDPLWMPIDSGMTERCATLESQNLNIDHFTLETDKSWISARALPQKAGTKARIQICVAVPALREANGGRLMSGTVIKERLEIRADNPLQPTAEARSISDFVMLNLPVANEMQWLYIPAVFNRGG